MAKAQSTAKRKPTPTKRLSHGELALCNFLVISRGITPAIYAKMMEEIEAALLAGDITVSMAAQKEARLRLSVVNRWRRERNGDV